MVYLDYAATCPKVKYPSSAYGIFLNPNANYAHKEKRLLSEAENRVKKAIRAKGGNVIFGGTSSQLIENLFTHIVEETNEYLTICSVYEHDAMWRFADQWGNIDSLKHVIQTYHGDKQLIVSLMGVNNLTGEIFPVEEIGKLCHEHNAFYICDMTAMIGHTPIPTNIGDWCDCAVWSGHKLGTELGIGGMWVSDRFDEWLNGFKLHGTPNVAGALCVADATEDAVKRVNENMWKWRDFAEFMGSELNKAGILVRGVYWRRDANRTHAINAIRLNGINADTLQQYLASKQIYVGLGASACAESHDYRVLNAFGLSDKEASEVIRVSFGEASEPDDVTTFVKRVKEFKERFIG